MADTVFENRKQAGRQLAKKLVSHFQKQPTNTILLALPRGGVPIGVEISKALQVPLDVLIVKKIGIPFKPEYGIGAATEGDFHWVDQTSANLAGASTFYLNEIIKRKKQEIEEHVRVYRNGKSLPSFYGKTVIIADDGLATGATARTAAMYAKSKGAEHVIFTAPVCAKSAVDEMGVEIDEVITLQTPVAFFSVNQFFKDFSEVSEEQALTALKRTQSLVRGPDLKTFIPLENGMGIQAQIIIPPLAKGIVLLSSRNKKVAKRLHESKLGTVLFDLLTEEESADQTHVFKMPLLAGRLISIVRWIRQQRFAKDIPVGYFGSSNEVGIALWAASELKNEIAAIVSREGRPDIAMNHLEKVDAPTLLIVGDIEPPLVEMNRKALTHLHNAHLILLPGGSLEAATYAATTWFLKYFGHQKRQSVRSDTSSMRA